MKEKDKKTLIVYNWNKYYGKEMYFSKECEDSLDVDAE